MPSGKGDGWLKQFRVKQLSYVMTDGKKDKTVHINRLCKRIQPAYTHNELSDDTCYEAVWDPPMTEHEVVEYRGVPIIRSASISVPDMLNFPISVIGTKGPGSQYKYLQNIFI